MIDRTMSFSVCTECVPIEGTHAQLVHTCLHYYVCMYSDVCTQCVVLLMDLIEICGRIYVFGLVCCEMHSVGINMFGCL